MEAAGIVLVANGAGKAAAVAQAIEGPLEIQLPASVLQEHHHVTFVLDDAVASEPTLKSKSLLVSDW